MSAPSSLASESPTVDATPIEPAAFPAPSRHEMRVAGWLLLAFLLLVTLPYVWTGLLTPPGQVWGGLLFSADDQNVHLMWARQARDGGFFFRDLYTTESLMSGERPLFWNVLPWLMGVFSRFSGLEVGIWYHVFRVALAAVALWQLHGLALAVTRSEARFERARLATLALAIFTTGAGFLAPLLPINWLDRPDTGAALVPEAFFLLSAFIYPLNIASFALLALVFHLILTGRNWGLAFVGAVLLGNIHTYDAIPLLVITLVWGVWQFKSDPRAARVALAAFVGALLPVAYQVVVFRGSEEFRIKALTLTAPPPVWEVLASFLFLALLAAWGWRAAKELPARRLMLLWIGVTLVLMYAPLSFGRKMIEGLQLPLLVLGGLGLASLVEKAPASGRAAALCCAVAVLALSPLQTFGWILNNAADNNRARWHYYMPVQRLSQNTVESLRVLDRQPQGVVLCLPLVGAYVPRATGHYTYYGHWAETLDADRKRGEVIGFMSGRMPLETARALIAQNKIRYVLDTEPDHYFTVLGSASSAALAHALGLTVLFTRTDPKQGTVTLYEVPETL